MSPQEWLKTFRSDALPVIRRQFAPERMVLFGSHARGTATAASDIDVILVSSRFEGVPFVRRMPMVLKAIRFRKHVDALCYTPAEFERIKTSSAVVADALACGLAMV